MSVQTLEKLCCSWLAKKKKKKKTAVAVETEDVQCPIIGEVFI